MSGDVIISAVRDTPTRPISDAQLPITAAGSLAWFGHGHLDSAYRPCVQTHEERKSSQTRSGIPPAGLAPGQRLGRGTLRLALPAGAPTPVRWRSGRQPLRPRENSTPGPKLAGVAPAAPRDRSPSRAPRA